MHYSRRFSPKSIPKAISNRIVATGSQPIHSILDCINGNFTDELLCLSVFWRWLIITAEEKLLENGYEDVKYLTDFSYDDALIGVTHDNRAVYDYEKMVEWLISTEGFTEEEAIEWIDYNTLRAIGYFGEVAPIIMYPI